MKLTERQKMLLNIAIKNLDNLNHIVGIELHTDGLNYDECENDLSALAEDIKIEFEI